MGGERMCGCEEVTRVIFLKSNFSDGGKRRGKK
jgi:hypothetical protein